MKINKLLPAGALMTAGLVTVVLVLTLGAPAQIVASMSMGAPSHANPHFNTASADARVGIALPPVPHLMLMWNLADLGVDRIARQGGVSIGTGVEAWFSPAARPAQSHLPLVLAEAGVGRRWGMGLHGFTVLGVGVGWSIGDWVPYLEFRRRSAFHSGRPHDDEVLLGVKFVLFG